MTNRKWKMVPIYVAVQFMVEVIILNSDHLSVTSVMKWVPSFHVDSSALRVIATNYND